MAGVCSGGAAVDADQSGSLGVSGLLALAASWMLAASLATTGVAAASSAPADLAGHTPAHSTASIGGQCQVGAACQVVQRGRFSALIPAQAGGTFAPQSNPQPVVEQDQPMSSPEGTIRPPGVLGAEIPLAGELLPTTAAGAGAFAASAGLKSFMNTDLGKPPFQASPQEPTAAVGEKVVWYTGNSSVALSVDNGQTFKYFNPASLLPEAGLQFCCDQIVSYAPKAKLFVWITQYWCGFGSSSPPSPICYEPGTTSNRLRIAVASPKALRAHRNNPGAAWHYWNITTNAFGKHLLAGPGTWFDQSKMAVNRKDVIWSVDVIRGNAEVSSVMMRFSLAALARRSTLRFGFITESHQKMNVAQDLNTTTAYFVGNEGTTTERIWSWPLSSSNATLHVIEHASVPKFNAEILGTSGKNWYSRWGTFPGSVESTALTGHTLYVVQGTGRAYCVAKCSPGETPKWGPVVFKEPAVFVSIYDVTTWAEVGERWLYNSKVALTWPALQVDGAGDVGLVVRTSQEGKNPRPEVAFLTPGEGTGLFFAEPEGAPQLTGDYYSLRPGRTRESFVMTAQTVQSNGEMHWDYIEWGRGTGP